MSILELKIPPLLVVVIMMILMWLVAQGLSSPSMPQAFKFIVSFNFLGIGLMFIASAVMSFRRANTTLNPIRPDASSVLVTSDMYEVTRNPMYLGCLLVLMAYAVFLSNIYTLALLVIFVLYMNRFQILPEERALQFTFGQAFVIYKKKVHRWL